MSAGMRPTGPGLAPFVSIVEDLQTLKRNWFWLLLLGIALVIVGMAAIGSSFIATLASVVFFGYLLIGSGIVYLVGLIWTRCWGGFFLQLLAGILSLVVGAFMVAEPIRFAVAYTLFLAILFIIQGIFRILGALSGQFQGWFWILLSGIISVFLGLLIWQNLPYSGLEVIGLLVGIELLFSGISHIVVAITLRSLPTRPERA